jgi:hypothetical protein
MSGFTGLRIEPHQVLTGETICVLYKDGKREAVLYLHANGELKLVYEPHVRVQVLKRIGPVCFEDVTPHD